MILEKLFTTGYFFFHPSPEIKHKHPCSPTETDTLLHCREGFCAVTGVDDRNSLSQQCKTCRAVQEVAGGGGEQATG
ncbi:MAG: hypothetical protein ACQES0_00330 [Bacteroidota bacterium]